MTPNLLIRRFAPWLFLLGLFTLWEVVCDTFSVTDLVLPKPTRVLTVLAQKHAALWPHAAQTLFTTLTGFFVGALLGILLGVTIGLSRLAYDVTYPLLVAFNSIPKVAVVPIFVIWFGSGTVPAILTSVAICVFPVVVNVATGLTTTPPETRDILRALGATRFEILWRVELPGALPYLFASLKIAVPLAFVGSVLSETVAGNRGIGSVMILATSNFDVPLVFAGFFILAAMGVALYAVCALLEARFCDWARRSGGVR